MKFAATHPIKHRCLGAILLLFGAKRLPEIGRSLGRGIREFKSSVEGKDDEPAKSDEKEPADKS